MISGLKKAAVYVVATAIVLCQQPAYKNLQGTPVEPLEKFQFTLKSSNVTSGSIATAGAKTLTVRPCPLGVQGSDPSHYLRISGGTGTAENVLITGGTCTSGAASGTLQFTTANTHTGAWTISSATAGIREGVLFLEGRTGGGELRLPYGNVTVYKTITMEGTPAVTISGCGVWCSTVIMDTSNTTDDVLNCTAGTCIVYFKDFTIAGHSASSAGAAIHIKDNAAGKPKIVNVRAVDTAGGFRIENSDYVQILNSYYDQQSNYTNAVYGAKVEGLSSDVEISGGRYISPEVNDPGMLQYGLWITGADGLVISNVMVRANIGVYINPVFGTGSLLFGSVFMNNSVIDRCRTNAISVLATGTPTGNDFFGNVYFNSMHIAGDSAMETADLVTLDTTAMGVTRSGISITNSMVVNGTRNGIKSTSVNGLIIAGNTIANNDTANTGGAGVYISSGNYINLTGNILQDTNGTPKQDYGLLLGGTISYLNATGNSAINNASTAFNNGATLTNSVFSNNIGVDDSIPQLSSAATLTLPSTLQKTIRLVTSAATVSVINTPTVNGDTRTFLCDSGITFTASGSTWGVAATLPATTANQVVTCTAFTGTSKWYCR